MNCKVCNKNLRKDNTIGVCREHRGQSQTRRQYEKQWQSENKSQYTEAKRRWSNKNLNYYVEYRNSDVNHKLAHALRVRIRKAVKTGSATKNLGCTMTEFKAHLEKQFTEGMNWDNYGQWHIDHIKPLSAFDLTNLSELAEACHFTNMQPLWAAENISKNDKLDYYPTSARHTNV